MTDARASQDSVYDDGELWSFLRSVLSQGRDIYLDHEETNYETFSAALDAAALERLEPLKKLLAKRRAPETTDARALLQAVVDNAVLDSERNDIYLVDFVPIINAKNFLARRARTTTQSKPEREIFPVGAAVRLQKEGSFDGQESCGWYIDKVHDDGALYLVKNVGHGGEMWVTPQLLRRVEVGVAVKTTEGRS